MAHASITKSRSVKKPFKVRIIADNNEVLSHHLLTTRLNVRKNLVALMRSFGGERITVVDRSGKKEERYILSKDNGIDKVFL